MTTTSATETDWHAVAGQTLRRGAVPLRVSVYTAIARTIRSGSPAPGSLLPFDAELCEVFGVSRTVMREALILLEEDGLVRTRRGIGRFVAERLPEIGLEQLQPLERLLSAGDTAPSVRALRRDLEKMTDFTSRGLDLADDATAWFWESLIVRDDEPVALCQEWIPAGPRLEMISPALAAAMPQSSGHDRTLLTLIDEVISQALGPSSCDISVSTAGTERGAMFGASRKTPILVLSHHVLFRDRPLYLAKHMIRAEAGHIHVAQSAPN